MDHDSNNQDLDQVHRYVHQGLLQGGIQVDTNIVAIQVDQDNEEQDQHTDGENHEREVSIETQEIDQHTAGEKEEKELDIETQREEEHGDTQIMGG
eukprot:9727989-Heterocapsa_arctica.AAC.1